MSKPTSWKASSSGPSGKITQTQVTQAIMWLCAQPSVAKHIRKLWKNPVRDLAKIKPRTDERK